MAELSFYFSLACTLLIDNKRKDFNEQIIHHVATLALLGLSYVCNFTRIGTLVMWCHDVSDIFLESAKLCVYAKPTIAKVPVADVLFAIFGIIFFVRYFIKCREYFVCKEGCIFLEVTWSELPIVEYKDEDDSLYHPGHYM